MKLFTIGGKDVIIHGERVFIELEGVERQKILGFCRRCGSMEHKISKCTFDPDNPLKVSEASLLREFLRLRQEGKNSLEISKTLSISLKKVNELWREFPPAGDDLKNYD